MSLEEKRKYYKCGSKYVTLEEIPKFFQSSEPELNEKLSVFNGDITTLEIDTIVNAANSKLAGGGGGKHLK